MVSPSFDLPHKGKDAVKILYRPIEFDIGDGASFGRIRKVLTGLLEATSSGVRSPLMGGPTPVGSAISPPES